MPKGIYIRPKLGCYIEGCPNPYWAKGLCKFHDQRERRGTKLDQPKGFKSINREGWIHKGYKWIINSIGLEVMEHRQIMEDNLGRKLSYDEVVHHKDGDKLNNDPNNLEIKSRGRHTSEHRNHQTPCIICGILDPHGTRGRCANHHQKYLRGTGL